MKQFFAAIRFLTILPLPGGANPGERVLGGALPFFPVVGLLIGAVIAGADWGLGRIFPIGVTSVFTVIFLIAVSGGLHIDGLADTADGFFSARPREGILAIMKDSRTGPMGVAAVVCVVALKIALIASVTGPWRWWVLMITPLAGRCALLVHLALLPYVRPEGGLAGIFHRNRSRGHALWALAVMLAVGSVCGAPAGADRRRRGRSRRPSPGGLQLPPDRRPHRRHARGRLRADRTLPRARRGGDAPRRRRMTQMHGGNIVKLAAAAGRPAGEILDFSANINPLGPPEWLRPLISAEVSSLVHYPDPDCTELVGAFAERFGVAADEVIMGNGETELLHLLPRVLGKGRAVIPVPSYSDYAAACELAGLAVEPLPLKEERGFALDFAEIERKLTGDEIVILGRPNNPTGTLIPAEDLRNLAARHPATAFAVDEAFADFTDQESLLAGGAAGEPRRPQVAHQVLRNPGPPPGRRRRRAGDHPAAPRPGAPLVGQHPRPGRGRGGPPRRRIRRRDPPFRDRAARGAHRGDRGDPGARRLSRDGELPPRPDRPRRNRRPRTGTSGCSPTGSPSASATTSPASTGGSSA